MRTFFSEICKFCELDFGNFITANFIPSAFSTTFSALSNVPLRVPLSRRIADMKPSKISHYPEEIPIHLLQYSETLGTLKPFLNISKFFGVPNFSVVDTIVSRGGFWTFLALLSVFILLNQVFLLVVKIGMGEDFVKVSGADIIMRIHVILTMGWSLLFSSRLAEALRKAPVVETRINKVYGGPEEDILSPWALRRKGIFWTLAYLAIGILLTAKELLMGWLIGEKSIVESWEKFGEEGCGLKESIMLHSTVGGVYCTLMELSTNFIWLFGDWLLLLVAMVLTHLYKRLNANGIRRIEPSRLSAIEIDLVREHHGLLSKLVKHFDDALASLNLISLVFNTTFIILALYSLVTSRKSDRRNNSSHLVKSSIKVGVAVFKLLAGLVHASILHYRAHEGITEVRSWPMAREFNDFSLMNGRASVIHAFVNQLSEGHTGLTIGKIVVISGKLLALLFLGIGTFFAFARITISSCSRQPRVSLISN